MLTRVDMICHIKTLFVLENVFIQSILSQLPTMSLLFRFQFLSDLIRLLQCQTFEEYIDQIARYHSLLMNRSMVAYMLRAAKKCEIR